MCCVRLSYVPLLHMSVATGCVDLCRVVLWFAVVCCALFCSGVFRCCMYRLRSVVSCCPVLCCAGLSCVVFCTVVLRCCMYRLRCVVLTYAV